MVYFVYILLFILFYIIIKTKEIKINREKILFYGKYIAIAIMGIGTNIISAGTFTVIVALIPILMDIFMKAPKKKNKKSC